MSINADVEFIETFGDKMKAVPLAVFTEIADLVMKKLGVPE